jgi:nucleoside phosphorylase
LALPTVMVGTFQNGSYARLVEQTAAALPVGFQPAGHPGGTGGSGQHGILVGKLPGTRRSIAVTRLSLGAPAAAIALEIAIARGVRTILVCGSAGSLQPAHPLGSTVVVESAEREDGTSHHYLPAEEITSADPVITHGLVEAARKVGLTPAVGRSWTIDAPYRETVGAIQRHQAAGVTVVEMEAAALFAVAKVRGAQAGLIVAVSDELFQPWNPGFHLPVFVDALTKAADAILLAAERLPEHRNT